MDRRREYVLGALLLILSTLAVIVLGAVLQTVVFAVTVAYVLYPLKRLLCNRGLSDRVASAIATAMVFLAVAIVFAPLIFVLYNRRTQFTDVLQSVPESMTARVGGFELTVETAPYVDAAVESVQETAVVLALAAPRLALQFMLFTFVLYGLLYRPRSIRAAVLRLVPDGYHDIISRLHERTQTTLHALYVLQAATAFGTFLIAVPLFWLLGYSAPLSLAAIAGLLQFIPVLGPSLLVLALVANDLLVGMPVRAAMLLVSGLLLIALLPDVVIRTKLASSTAKVNSILYFIGFVGGILTIGTLGIVIGPLVVALLVEVVTLLSEHETTPAQAGSEVDRETPTDETTHPNTGEKQPLDEDVQTGGDA